MGVALKYTSSRLTVFHALLYVEQIILSLAKNPHLVGPVLPKPTLLVAVVSAAELHFPTNNIWTIRG